MARKARIKSDYGMFYIQQRSHEGQVLFKDDSDRAYLLELLEKTRQQFQFDLIAYCMRSDTSYHLIIDLKGTDLSKLMKSLNISYAMYRGACGQLYKDRYKSQYLENELQLKEQLEKLQNSGEASGQWHQFCQANTNTSPCEGCIKTITDAHKWLEESCNEADLSVNALFKDKMRRNALILELRKKSTLSLKEIGQLFGGISESSVCKIIKDCH